MSNELSIFEEILEYKPSLKKLVIKSVNEILNTITSIMGKQHPIFPYFQPPKLSYRENGLPILSTNIYRISEYDDALSIIRKKDQNTDNCLPTLIYVVNFINKRPILAKRLGLENWLDSRNNSAQNIFKYYAESIPNIIATKYIYTYNTFTSQPDKINDIYSSIEKFIFSEELEYNTIVPILFISFDFESLPIGENCKIIRIDDKLQLARSNIKSNTVSVHETVASSATHALVLEKRRIKNSGNIIRFDSLTNPSTYPLGEIDYFFGILRLINEVQTGYAQLLSYPLGWANDFKADLPLIFGTTVRAYPSYFEDYYWNYDAFPVINKEEAVLAGKLYGKMLKLNCTSINIAVKRLNQCLIRDSKEDSILDATTALEVLLLSDEHHEITHKLALRAAAISKLDKNFLGNPADVFKGIKKIYGYRSSIVHGGKNTEKNNSFTLSTGEAIPTNQLAIYYLRKFIKIMILSPKFAHGTKGNKGGIDPIDEELILNILNSNTLFPNDI